MWLKKCAAVLVCLMSLAPAVYAAQNQKQAGAADAEKAENDRSPRVPTFALNGDLAGELQVFTTRYEDTFAAIGHDEALGYLELVKRSEEHTSELQSRPHLVCRLLLEKK